MKALMLFGSKARHDSEPGSDIDLLAIYDGEKIKSIFHGSVHLFLYPEKTLLDKMSQGDLFALHLKEESIVLNGNEVAEKVFSKFKYKNSYDYDISVAVFLASEILMSYHGLKNKKIANKKLAWCLRTVIIATSAGKREPIFGKKKLSNYIKIPDLTSHDIEILINIKNFSNPLPDRYLDKFNIFLKNFDFIKKDYSKLLNESIVINTMRDLHRINNSNDNYNL